MITVPQIKSAWLSFLAIIIVSFSLAMFNGLRHGEARTLANWAEICYDSATYAATAGFGWIALKSPLAKAVVHLLQEESTKVTETPTGATVTETTKTSVQVEKPAEPDK